MAVLPPDPVFNLRQIEMGAVSCICFHNVDRLFCGTPKGAVFLWDLQVRPSNIAIILVHGNANALFFFFDSRKIHARV